MLTDFQSSRPEISQPSHQSDRRAHARFLVGSQQSAKVRRKPTGADRVLVRRTRKINCLLPIHWPDDFSGQKGGTGQISHLGRRHISIQICSLLAPCRRSILIATKDMLFRRQDTRAKGQPLCAVTFTRKPSTAGAGVRFQISILFFQILPRSVPRAPTRARHDQGAGTRGRRQWRRKVTTFAAV
jgi:hypothetical protein